MLVDSLHVDGARAAFHQCELVPEAREELDS